MDGGNFNGTLCILNCIQKLSHDPRALGLDVTTLTLSFMKK